jgi:hypothetical protein
MIGTSLAKAWDDEGIGVLSLMIVEVTIIR